MSHVSIVCLTEAGVGSALNWRVVVEGQSNAAPLSSYAAPRITSVAFLPMGVVHASTHGGTVLAVTGAHFGPLVSRVWVSVTTPLGDLPTSNCTMPQVSAP